MIFSYNNKKCSILKIKIVSVTAILFDLSIFFINYYNTCLPKGKSLKLRKSPLQRFVKLSFFFLCAVILMLSIMQFYAANLTITPSGQGFS